MKRNNKPFYVKDVINLSIFHQFNVQLVAGKEGLSRQISHATVFENENAIVYMTGGEFLFSNGNSFSQEIEKQQTIMEQLNEKK